MTAPRRLARSSSPPISAWNPGSSAAPWPMGWFPARDRSRARWSAQLADAALAGIGVIRAAAGSIPDLGAVRAASLSMLTALIGVRVPVAE